MTDENKKADPNEDAVRREKARIVNRAMIYLTSMFITLTLVSAFFLAPEFLEARKNRKRVAELEQSVRELEKQVAILNAEPEPQQAAPDIPLSAKISHQIERVENFGEGVAGLGGRLRALEEKIGSTSQNLGLLIRQIEGLEQSLQGQQSLVAALEEIRKVLAAQQQKAENPPAPADAQGEKNLALLKEVKPQDLKAAAMLLTLGQFRKSMDRNAPLKDDLQLLRQLAQDDADLVAAIDRLAPYAESGILSREQLGMEFKGLASDIVISELRGEDASWTEKAKERLSNLVKIRREGYVEGEETEAVVARAEYLLDQGDIDGAIAELQSLKGPAAQTAAPWLEKANAVSDADNLFDLASEKVLQRLSSSSNPSLNKIIELISNMREKSGAAAGNMPEEIIILDMSPKTVPGPAGLPSADKAAQ